MNPDGSEKEIFCAGLRNPYGIAFNADGEAFTYDADAEFDMGTPWYRPTKVKHLTSGADFGWRAVTGSWPPYYPDHPDNTQATLKIGKGSPTGLKFGTRSQFPVDYQKALFILDWTYGRILAVHLRPREAPTWAVLKSFCAGNHSTLLIWISARTAPFISSPAAANPKRSLPSSASRPEHTTPRSHSGRTQPQPTRPRLS